MKAANPRAAQFAKNVERALKARPPEESLHLKGPGTTSLETWFLGPKAENQFLLREFVQTAVDMHCRARMDYFPNDPPFVTEERRQSESFQTSLEQFRGFLAELCTELRGSIPLASYRNQSHMYWDITVPGAVGYLAGMLYNQNNVAVEASPVTTHLEMIVGDDLCEMLGFHVPTDSEIEAGAARPWGHIACDGSVANLESMWASRNLKFWPISVAEALKNESSLAAAREITVPLPAGGRAPLIGLDRWTQLNLKVDDVLALTNRIVSEYKIDADTLNRALTGYTLQSLGFAAFNDRFLPDRRHHCPAVMAPSTAHYSWPKGAAILGLGSGAVMDIHVDLDARMDVAHLRTQLDRCVAEQRPVAQVVAVIGSTEESAVDPLADIIALREEYRQAGLEFEVHVDGAWGGYFAAMLRESAQTGDGSGDDPGLTPDLHMSPYVRRQYDAFPQADSITIDPHKAGYIPYPAGGLCYRDGSMRNLVSFTAPVVYHGGIDPTVGVYGVEGSKPGAAAAGVYLSHRTIRTDQSGYGKILGKCTWNSKRLYAAVVTMAGPDDPFLVTPFQRLPAEKEAMAKGLTPEQTRKAVKEQLDLIRTKIVPASNQDLNALLKKDPDLLALFRELGSDQIIITYSFNFRTADGTPNTDLGLISQLNDAVYRSLSLHEYQERTYGEVPPQPMFVTSSNFDPAVYGQDFVDTYARRLGAVPSPGVSIPFMISTTMDPWVTDTQHTDESPDGNFIPQIVEALRSTVATIIRNGQPFQPIDYSK